MKLFSTILSVLLITSAGAALAVMSGASVVLAPNAMHWVMAGPGPAKGTSSVILVGNPNKSGTSFFRVKMPSGYVNDPHYHVVPEYITVLQGALLFGFGDTVNKSKARLMPAGSFIMVPAGVHHWSIAQGETIEQIGGEGPVTNIQIKKSM